MQHAKYEVMKKCKTCGERKVIKQLGKSIYDFFAKTKTSHGAHCKRCVRSKHLQKKYGITIGEWEHMLYNKQHGECACCGKQQVDSKSTFHVDHNHRTNEIRAIICGYCNRYLMMHLHDNPKRAVGLATYLLQHFDGFYYRR